MIQWWSGPRDLLPKGYTVCDGSCYEKSEYSTLYNAIQQIYTPENATNEKFCIPDLMGERRFIRAGETVGAIHDDTVSLRNVTVVIQDEGHTHDDALGMTVTGDGVFNTALQGEGPDLSQTKPFEKQTGLTGITASLKGGDANETAPKSITLIPAICVQN